MAAIGPKDHLSNLPIELKAIIAHMSPDILIQGEKTNKALKALLGRNEVWVAMAKKLNITIVDEKNAKKEVLKEVIQVNKLLKKYFPQVVSKAKDPLGQNVELHAYIKAHSQEKATIEGFEKVIREFWTRENELNNPNQIVNAVQAFIDEGVLQNQGLNWDSYLMEAIGHRKDSEYLGVPRKPFAVFEMLLKEYLKNKSVPESDKVELMISLYFYMIRQNNYQQMDILFSIGSKINEEHLGIFLLYHAQQNYPDHPGDFLDFRQELTFRFLLEKFGQSKEKVLPIIEKYEKRVSDRYNPKTVKKVCQQLRNVCNGKSILQSNPDIEYWLSTQDLYFANLVAKYCTLQEKLKIITVLENGKWRNQQLDHYQSLDLIFQSPSK